jgi:hypothetical protein
MKISYSWLKNYIHLEQSPEEICAILTQIGLEVGSIEEIETIKGGMKGLIIGEVVDVFWECGVVSERQVIWSGLHAFNFLNAV